MANILYESCSTGGGSFVLLQYTGGAKAIATSFTPSTGHSLVSLSLYLYKRGSPGEITVEIYASGTGASADKPTGAVLATTTFEGNDLPLAGSVAWLTDIDFATVATLVAGIKYVIVMTGGDTNTTNYVAWRYTTADVYAGGKRSFSNDGTTFFVQNTHDNWFKEYGSSVQSSGSQLHYSKALVAAGGNALWYESPSGTMVVFADSDATLNTVSAKCDMVEALEKVFVVNETTLKVADFGNVSIVTTDLGTNPPDYHTVLTGGTSGAKMVVDYITNLDDGEACTIYGSRTTTETFASGETVTGTDDDDNAISFAISAAETAGPFWYDWTTFGNAAGDDTTFGALPDSASLICLYRGRVVIAGDPDYPNQWYMSRQVNPWDMAVTSVDAQAAVAGQDSDAGKLGDVVVALIPYKDDYLVFGCANSMWLLSGDPRSNGELSEFDLTTGIYGKKSWCFDKVGNLYFWGNNGLYQTALPGAPVCISQLPLPKLIGDEAANASTHSITMGYDAERNGVLVCITKLSDGSNSNYFYSIMSGGFFPESYPVECGVYSMFFYEALDATYRKLVLGSFDGYLRYLNEATKNDNAGASGATAISSHVTFGPLMIASDAKREGKLTGMIPITGGGESGGSETDSDTLTCKIFTAKSADSILEKMYANSTPVFSRTVQTPGRSRTNILRHKLRGVYTGIHLSNDVVGESWALDQIILDGIKAGRLK